MSELPAPGADVEQIAGLADALADERCNARDVVGGVDTGCIQLDRIDRCACAGDVARGLGTGRPIEVRTRADGHGDTCGNEAVTANCRRLRLTALRFGATGPATSGHPACCARA
jgi:hypothetical protein